MRHGKEVHPSGMNQIRVQRSAFALPNVSVLVAEARQIQQPPHTQAMCKNAHNECLVVGPNCNARVQNQGLFESNVPSCFDPIALRIPRCTYQRMSRKAWPRQQSTRVVRR